MVRFQLQVLGVVLRPRLLVGLRIQRLLLVARVLVLVIVPNCLPKNERQKLMQAFWLVQLRVICAGVQQPLQMHQSTKHCHMLVWQVLAQVVFFFTGKLGQYTQVPLNLQQQHTPQLHNDFQMVLTGVPVRLEILFTTVVQGVPFLQPVMKALAYGDLKVGDLNLLGISKSPGEYCCGTGAGGDRSAIRL